MYKNIFIHFTIRGNTQTLHEEQRAVLEQESTALNRIKVIEINEKKPKSKSKGHIE